MLALNTDLDLKLRRFLQWSSTMNIPTILIGCSLLCSSLLPWLKDPLGGVYSAWQLPLYSGWFYHVNFLNYGSLCLFCALCIFLLAYRGWNSQGKYHYFVHMYKIKRFISILPIVLFFLQSLFIDVSACALLAEHERQMLLIQQYFGYQGTSQLVILHPLTLDISTFWERLQILLDGLSYGPLCLCAVSWLLPADHHFGTPTVQHVRPGRKRKIAITCFVFVLITLFLRAFAGMACEYLAKQELSVGNYNIALILLDSARFFNPEFEQVAYYHRERGQAQYFLSPGQLTTDSRVYLASIYRTQADYLDAYQQLLVAWQAHPNVAWIVDEMDITLECLVESRRPLRGLATSRINIDNVALLWLNVLAKADPSNSYAIYMAGRIQYDLHNYSACIAYMSALLQSNLKDNIRSSVYTYMALSENDLGNYANARLLLFKAVSLDPDYHNNTAREELSGLH